MRFIDYKLNFSIRFAIMYVQKYILINNHLMDVVTLTYLFCWLMLPRSFENFAGRTFCNFLTKIVEKNVIFMYVYVYC